MFDIGWTEIAVIAGVAIIVVGPKDLPGMLRTVGRTMGQVRRTANDFKRQFDDALRDAERQADLEDTKKTLQSISKMNPLADLKKDVESAVNTPAGKSAKPAEPPVPSALTEAPEASVPAAAAPEPTASGVEGEEPVTSGSGPKSDAA
ncbi:Sec-independent protein translocase protein TatB [Afifella sp. IM 167]|uniref:Sec-independent protein translocase protein TatB n=1 Tax=Afifella sp. IM 167 TaxID=2033586 RepID=UPI001CCFF765|nr:Sec-independent protein translocase protein TatB [Afifella sp. IM 167]MBZ8132556.1 twin-arginine translocase subunit TatB [Afifella sp. IM 167]